MITHIWTLVHGMVWFAYGQYLIDYLPVKTKRPPPCCKKRRRAFKVPLLPEVCLKRHDGGA